MDPHSTVMGGMTLSLVTKHLLEKWLLMEVVKQPEGRASISPRDWAYHPEDSGTMDHRGQGGRVEGRRLGEVSESQEPAQR